MYYLVFVLAINSLYTIDTYIYSTYIKHFTKEALKYMMIGLLLSSPIYHQEARGIINSSCKVILFVFIG